MYPVLFEFGGFQIRSYGVIVILSFLLALWMSTREAERKGLGPKLVQDFALMDCWAGSSGRDFISSCFLPRVIFWSTPGRSSRYGAVASAS